MDLPLVSELSVESEEEDNLELLPLRNIPEVALDKIFCFLNGGSLSKAKLVNKTWHWYINSRIWRFPCNVRVLRRSLEQNVRAPNFTYLPNSYIDLPITGYASQCTSNKVCITSYANTPLAASRVCIYDVSQSSFWMVNNLFPYQLRKEAKYQGFLLTLTEDLLVVRILLQTEEYVEDDARSQDTSTASRKRKRRLSHENVHVLSLLTQTTIANETMLGLEYCCGSKTEEHSSILVFFQVQLIQVWDCSNINNIRRTQILLEPNIYTKGSFSYPHIVLEAIVLREVFGREQSFKIIKVWELGDKGSGISLIVDCKDRDQFFHDNKTILRDIITELRYFNNFFLTSSVVEIPGQNGNNSSLAIRSFSKDGQLLTNCFFTEYSPHDFVYFHSFGDRIYAEIDSDLWIYKKTKTNLGMKSTEAPEFEKYDHVSLMSHPMIREREVSEARVVAFWGGYQLLRLTTINFWGAIQ